MATKNANFTTPLNFVLLQEAEDCIRRYVHKVSKEANPTYAFLILHSDIMQALEFVGTIPEMTFKQFRVYFGLWDSSQNNQLRLFVVPVDDSGHDILPLDDEDRQGVYDFNAPCPATCDPSSPLNYTHFIG